MAAPQSQPLDLRTWIGREETVVDEVTVPAVRRLHALLDRAATPVTRGDLFPRGWQGTLCPPLARQSELGDDGHPERGHFIPPIPYVRRMAASVDMTIVGDLIVGETVTRKSTIEDVYTREGRSGSIVFLAQRNDFYGPSGLAVTEHHRVAFRDVISGTEIHRAGPKAETIALWTKPVIADPVLIFRYAAVAFSGHRIHYDYLYGTKTESYKDVMVSGGLNNLLLLNLLSHHASGKIIRYASRNHAPVYAFDHIQLCGAAGEKPGIFKLWITLDDGTVAVTAEVELS